MNEKKGFDLLIEEIGRYYGIKKILRHISFIRQINIIDSTPV